MGWFFFDYGILEYPREGRFECVGGPLDGESRTVFLGDRLTWSDGLDPEVTHLYDITQGPDGKRYLVHSRVLRDSGGPFG